MNVGSSRTDAITVSFFITSFWSLAIFAWQVVPDACDQVARELEALEGAQELVVGAVEGDLDLVREDLLAFLDVDDVVDDPANRVACRGEGAPDVQEVVPQIAETIAICAAGQLSTVSSSWSISSSSVSIRSR